MQTTGSNRCPRQTIVRQSPGRSHGWGIAIYWRSQLMPHRVAQLRPPPHAIDCPLADADAPVPPVPLCNLTHEPADKERQEAIAVDIYRGLGVRLEGSVVSCAGRIQERR